MAMIRPAQQAQAHEDDVTFEATGAFSRTAVISHGRSSNDGLTVAPAGHRRPTSVVERRDDVSA